MSSRREEAWGLGRHAGVRGGACGLYLADPTARI
jgi:hypothetical protein